MGHLNSCNFTTWNFISATVSNAWYGSIDFFCVRGYKRSHNSVTCDSPTRKILHMYPFFTIFVSYWYYRDKSVSLPSRPVEGYMEWTGMKYYVTMWSVHCRLSRTEARLSQSEDENKRLREDLKEMLDSNTELQQIIVSDDSSTCQVKKVGVISP